MKTAISIPESLFKRAERVARKLGVSRSELYARAVAALVEQYRRTDVTGTLDRIYAAEASTLDRTIARMQSAALKSNGW